ncbi:MAG: hypothetical protein JWN24_3097 [Phycisphaerales bacterium]|jgi:hypothetical protein|nr:hypothetical protein [Phycisphaerales bacterium]
MLRPLFTSAAALSLLLCVGTCVMWARSYQTNDELVWLNKHGWRRVALARGYVEVKVFLCKLWKEPDASYGLKYYRHRACGPEDYLVEVNLVELEQDDRYVEWGKMGFAWHSLRRSDGTLHALAVAPFWFIAAATVVLPLGWTARRWRSRIRGRIGRCAACGYDLRATPDRCPECGTVPSGRIKNFKLTHYPQSPCAETLHPPR